uniref:Altered inheritance of mitochondria protein 9, mitochondrial n=1 Tax=Penicillium aethiopicum TaxID=36650 RepID=D7PI02_PENAE|nr:unknown [Penicillium aethiopicum]
MEGGFSKALTVRTLDGGEYIVKIPCPNAGRPMYCTASEVAVLDFVRKFTTIPVPKVLAWSANSTNPVGAEYIVMERVPGVQMFKKWDEMGEINRLAIIKRLTQWERELAEIPFPAFGSLYHKGSLGDHESIPLDPSVDPEGLFCIGPSCDSHWLMQDSPNVHYGPWRAIGDLGESLINRSLLKSQHGLKAKLPASLNSPLGEHLITLDMAKEIMLPMATNHKLLEQSQPTLWHTDLHMGNIFVAEDDPGKVTGLIDWQHTSISPLFLQVRWPVFLTPPDDYPEGHVMPQLPPGYEDMDTQDKEIALYIKQKATWAKAYEVATFLNDRKAWRAMQLPQALKELFRRCGDTWDEGILPLRETLIEIFRSQQKLGFEGDLSLQFSDGQIAAHEKEFQAYEEWHEIRSFVKKLLDTDDEGWVPPERDFSEMRSRNKVLFDYYVSKPDLRRTPDEVRNLWPFPLDGF